MHHIDFTLLRPEVPLEAGVEHGLASGLRGTHSLPTQGQTQCQSTESTQPQRKPQATVQLHALCAGCRLCWTSFALCFLGLTVLYTFMAIKCILHDKVGNNLAVYLWNILSLPIKTSDFLGVRSCFPASVSPAWWKNSASVFQKNHQEKGQDIPYVQRTKFWWPFHQCNRRQKLTVHYT